MIFGATLSLAVLAVLSVVAIPSPDGHKYTAIRKAPGRECHAPIPAETIAKVDEEVRAGRLSHGKVPGDPQGHSPANIDVYWHVVAADETYEGGWIPQEHISAQMQVLNEDYASSGLEFTAKRITRIVDPNSFHEITAGFVGLQTDLKTKYRVGGPETLNVYTVGFTNDTTLGYATFPNMYADDPANDGVVIKYTTLPGGQPPYHLGKTLTHEAGHWLGLYHTFQDGCESLGDRVDDTPPQSTRTRGCPTVVQDSCPGGGSDSIHNFMDYSDDECLTEFTPGQIDRLRAHSELFRNIGATTEV